MNQTMPVLPQQASSFAGEVDALFFFIVAVTIFFAVGLTIAILYFAIRYRRRSPDEVPPEVHGSLALELAWTLVPLGLVGIMFVWGSKLYFHMNRPPDDAMTVTVVGKRWMWKVQQPTGQREINELHVPVGRAVKLVITSEDTIHSFFVPAFRIKKDAVPGRYNMAWFRATKPGNYHLFCAEYCGTEHSRMRGQIVAMEPEAYQAWLGGAPAGESPVAGGEKLFAEMNCIACHKPDSAAAAPVLNGLFGKPVRLAGGETVVADDGYIRESIVNPAAKVAAGYQPVMPTYQGQLSEEQLIALVAYIRSLQAAPAAAPASGAANVREGERSTVSR